MLYKMTAIGRMTAIGYRPATGCNIYTHKKALEACLLKQEKASSSSDGEGVAMDEAHTDDTAAAEKGASRDAGKRRFFYKECLAQGEGPSVPILLEARL